MVSASVAFQLAVYAFIFQTEDAACFIRRFLSLLGSSKHERDEMLKIHLGSRKNMCGVATYYTEKYLGL